MTAHGTAQENGKPQIVMFLKDLWVVRREQTKNTQNAIKETAQQEHTQGRSHQMKEKDVGTLERVGHIE